MCTWVEEGTIIEELILQAAERCEDEIGLRAKGLRS